MPVCVFPRFFPLTPVSDRFQCFELCTFLLSNHRRLDEDPGARPNACHCVLVDTEPKAVRAARAATAVEDVEGEAMLGGCPAIYGHSGRGNNWAHGYRQPGEGTGAYEDEGFSGSFGGSGAREDGRVLVDALRAVRRVMEPAAGHGRGHGHNGAPQPPVDILLIYSLAGGTGSGLGSRLLHELRASYPTALLLAAVVAPRMTDNRIVEEGGCSVVSGATSAGTGVGVGGDTPMQSYNVVLSMKKLRDHADAVFLFSNSALLVSLEREREREKRRRRRR